MRRHVHLNSLPKATKSRCNELSITDNNGKAIIEFSSDENGIHLLMDWLFENTTGRFCVFGTNRIYFEKEEDLAKAIMMLDVQTKK